MAVSLLLLFVALNSLGAESQTAAKWQCGNMKCLCSSTVTPQAAPNSTIATRGIHHTIAVCHLNTLMDVVSTSSSLPSNVTSLTITCTRRSTTDQLPPTAFSRHPDINEITLDGCSFQHINPQFGGRAENLTKLNFIRSDLPLFNTFSSLQSLIVLTITSSSMVNIPQFQELKNLRILNLSDNRVKFPGIVIDTSMDNRLHHLVNVSLAYNGIKYIPSKFFDILPSLKYINLDGNDLSELSIPPHTSKHLESLTAVGNHLDSFHLESFAPFRNLTQFRISGSGRNSLILDLEKSIALPNLQDFKMSGFKLNDSFWDLLSAPSLVKLDVSSNVLEKVELTHFSHLQKLYLQENNILELFPDTFRYQQNLLVVNISFNNVSHLPENLFGRNPDLIGFLAAGNMLTEISSRVFSGTLKMFFVDLSYNKITYIPGETISRTPNLISLYIQGNRLTSLPDFSNLPNLHTLDISHNRLHSLTYMAFKGLKSLEFLIANDNYLTFIPIGIFEFCPSLLVANFNSNKIRHIGNLKDHPRIVQLQFQNNSLTDFPAISPFGRMQALDSIFLDQNLFHTIHPKMFPGTVEIISMTQNPITHLMRNSLDNVPHLTIVNFDRSQEIMWIPQWSVQRYMSGDAIPSISLGVTYLSCDCWMGYLKVWDERRYEIPELLKRFPRFIGLENAFCFSPRYPDTALKFRDLPLKDFVCEYDEPSCFNNMCDCCISQKHSTCPCVLTCPTECQCLQGGSSYWEEYVHIMCREKNLTRIPDLIPSLATFVYLDGNSLDNLTRTDLTHLTHVEEIYLNNSRIAWIEDGIFDGMNNIGVIQLGANVLTSVRTRAFGRINSLTYLDLSYNRISHIDPGSFDGLINLPTLYLNNNELIYLNDNVLALTNLYSITLAFNNWSCDCGVIENLASYVLRRGNTATIKDKASICCYYDTVYSQETQLSSIRDVSHSLPSIPTLESQNSSVIEQGDGISRGSLNYSPRRDKGSLKLHHPIAIDGDQPNPDANVSCFTLITFNFERACEAIANITFVASKHDEDDINPAAIIVLSFTATVLVLLIISIGIFSWARSEIQAVMYAKVGVRILDKKASLDRQTKGKNPFDSFISYSQRDHEFVCNTLVPGLESKGYRTCVHYRDFPVGGDICDIITRAIHLSSRTIIIVSKHFLESNWCRYEFQTAHHHILKERSHRLILVLMEDIPWEDMDPDFRTHMKINTYLKVQDTWFWEKLRFSLPGISSRKYDEQSNDDNYLMMRGMRILARMEDYEGGDDRDVDGWREEENKNDDDDDDDDDDENRDGSNENGGIDNDIKDSDKRVRRIDWKKEEEKILSERRKKEKTMLTTGEDKGISVIDDRGIDLNWMNNINTVNVNKAFALNEEQI